MFNIGPLEMLTLAAIALVIFGPEKLPQLAKDAARMLRTLRELAQGARTQLNDELGPEFADFDLRSLNPRTAIKNALLGDEDFSAINPRTSLRNALLGDEDLSGLNPREVLNRAIRGEDDPAPTAPGSTATGATAAGTGAAGTSAAGATAMGTPGPGEATTGRPPVRPAIPADERTPWDYDAT